MSLIELISAGYIYPEASMAALSDISLEIREGEYVAIVGNNGSGKSTLVRLFNGLRLPSSGTVRVDGMDPGLRVNLFHARQRVALVFQSPVDQIVSTCVEEDVAFGPSNLGLPREEIERRVDRALATVGLGAERSRPTRSLSGGQQQKLAIAGSLAMEPECIVFDEATSMLDPGSKDVLLGLMDALSADGMAIVHVTHDMDDAARASRIIALDNGRLVFDGKPGEFFGGSVAASLAGTASPAEAIGLKPPKAVQAARIFGIEARIGEGPRSLAERAAAVLLDGKVQRAESATSAQAKAQAWESVSVSDDPAFSYEDVSFSYLHGTANEVKALSDLSLKLPAGRRVAFVGATGSGKSTALQLLDALLAPSSGRVISLGKDTSDPSLDL
ncbi:MAG: ATP-binding cassette domain-containing protein, partial [Spirochaetaceae bacterium]|nr:ATP-binding cassette domain-containing protein [Spirochaetaceae bacterium]